MKLTHDLVQRSMEPMKKALADAKLSLSDIDKDNLSWWFNKNSSSSRSC